MAEFMACLNGSRFVEDLAGRELLRPGRREALGLSMALGIAAIGLPTHAQTGAPVVKRIGILEMGRPLGGTDWFAMELERFGFVKGANLIIDRRMP